MFLSTTRAFANIQSPLNLLSPKRDMNVEEGSLGDGDQQEWEGATGSMGEMNRIKIHVKT